MLNYQRLDDSKVIAMTDFWEHLRTQGWSKDDSFASTHYKTSRESRAGWGNWCGHCQWRGCWAMFRTLAPHHTQGKVGDRPTLAHGMELHENCGLGPSVEIKIHHISPHKIQYTAFAECFCSRFGTWSLCHLRDWIATDISDIVKKSCTKKIIGIPLFTSIDSVW